MENTSQILFVIAFGFVSSALIAMFFGIFTGGGSFRISFRSISSVVSSFLICMFAGPYLALENGMRHWVSGNISTGLMLGAFVVAAVWSFCAGVFVVQLLAVLGIV